MIGKVAIVMMEMVAIVRNDLELVHVVSCVESRCTRTSGGTLHYVARFRKRLVGRARWWSPATVAAYALER